MKKHKILSATSLYILYILIGYQGPFSFDLGDEHHPHNHTHAHKKHVAQLLVRDNELDQLVKIRKPQLLNS